uniref:Uncharacterized protein n=1 Tax=Anopheles coluzzii TaxID=1518534 RepID=A0A8W7PPV6_ANOCL
MDEIGRFVPVQLQQALDVRERLLVGGRFGLSVFRRLEVSHHQVQRVAQDRRQLCPDCVQYALEVDLIQLRVQHAQRFLHVHHQPIERVRVLLQQFRTLYEEAAHCRSHLARQFLHEIENLVLFRIDRVIQHGSERFLATIRLDAALHIAQLSQYVIYAQLRRKRLQTLSDKIASVSTAEDEYFTVSSTGCSLSSSIALWMRISALYTAMSSQWVTPVVNQRWYSSIAKLLSPGLSAVPSVQKRFSTRYSSNSVVPMLMSSYSMNPLSPPRCDDVSGRSMRFSLRQISSTVGLISSASFNSRSSSVPVCRKCPSLMPPNQSSAPDTTALASASRMSQFGSVSFDRRIHPYICTGNRSVPSGGSSSATFAIMFSTLFSVFSSSLSPVFFLRSFRTAEKQDGSSFFVASQKLFCSSSDTASVCIGRTSFSSSVSNSTNDSGWSWWIAAKTDHWMKASVVEESPLWAECCVSTASPWIVNLPDHQYGVTLDDSSSCSSRMRNRWRCSWAATWLFFSELKFSLIRIVPWRRSLFFLSRLYHISMPEAGIDCERERPGVNNTTDITALQHYAITFNGMLRWFGLDAMYIVTNGSDRPFESFGSRSFASTISTFSRSWGASLSRAICSISLCFSSDILNASCM